MKNTNPEANRRKPATLLAVTTALLLTFCCTEPAGADEMRSLVAEEFGFTFSVPDAWKPQTCAGEVSMKLHFLALPAVRVRGHFSVHVLDRGCSDAEAWADCHRTKNLAGAYGRHRILSEETAAAGTLPARLFHVADLEGRPRYGLLEALVLTDASAIIMSYLYDLDIGPKARQQMDAILASFSTAPEAMRRAANWYRKGRTIGLDRIGLFLSLPYGWTAFDSKTRNDVVVELPSGGSLRILGVNRVSRGVEGLRRVLSGKIRGFPERGCFEAVSFGSSEAGAYSARNSIAGDGVRSFIIGLTGSSGFGLVFESENDSEVALFEKMAADAKLVDPRETEKMRRQAVADLSRAIRKKNPAAARGALETLVLFPANSTTVGVVRKGLGSTDEIQTATVAALGRIGTREASKALGKTLVSRRSSESVKRSCVDALCMIGSRRERELLAEFAGKPAEIIGSDMVCVVQIALESLDRNRQIPR